MNSLGDDEVIDENIFSRAMDEALDPYLKIPRNLKVPGEASIEYPANFWDMCKLHGPEIRKPFARAVWMGYMLFGCVCVRCTHIKARSNIFNVPVDMDPARLAASVTFFHHGVCPKCGSKKSDLYKQGKLNLVNELVLVAGQRGSKSATTAAFIAYIVSQYLKAPKLATIMEGLQSYAPLTGTLLGLTATKSLKLLYVPVRDLMWESDWFKSYFKVLKDHYTATGEELYKFSPTGTSIRVFHKNLEIVPEAPVSRTLRGATRFFYAIDELGHFPLPDIDHNAEGVSFLDDERERANSEEAYSVLDNSLLTLRREVRTIYNKGFDTLPNAYGLCLSSPAAWNDKIMRLYGQKKGPEFPATVAVKLPTWEMSPLYKRDDPELAVMEKANPLAFERDFGCNPPELASSVFNPGQVSRMFGSTPNAFKVEKLFLPERNRLSGIIQEIHKANTYYPSLMVLDAGLSNNSFAFAIMHVNADNKVVITSVNEIMSPIENNSIIDPSMKVEFDYPEIYEKVLKPIIRGCNVRFVSGDRWNSAFVMHQIEKDFPTVKAKAVKMKADIVKAFRDAYHSERIVLPKLERLPEGQALHEYLKELPKSLPDYRMLEGFPTDHLGLQFMTVQSLRTDPDSFTKGRGFTDDIFRCILLGVPLITTDVVSAHLSLYSPLHRSSTQQHALAVSGSRLLRI